MSTVLKAEQRWRGRRVSAYMSPEAIEQIGTAAAPVLAGFSATLIGVVLADDPSRQTLQWPDLTVFLLTATAVVMLYSVAASVSARAYAARLSGVPAPWGSDMRQTEGNWWEGPHAGEILTYLVVAARARMSFEHGVAVFLFAVAMLLLPGGEVSVLRGAAVAVALGSGVWQFVFVTARRLAFRSRPSRFMPDWLRWQVAPATLTGTDGRTDVTS